MRTIRVSALLVTGTESQRVMHAIADRLQEWLPDVRRLDIQDAAHGMFWTQPDVFDRGVLEFIASRSA